MCFFLIFLSHIMLWIPYKEWHISYESRSYSFKDRSPAENASSALKPIKVSVEFMERLQTKFKMRIRRYRACLVCSCSARTCYSRRIPIANWLAAAGKLDFISLKIEHRSTRGAESNQIRFRLVWVSVWNFIACEIPSLRLTWLTRSRKHILREWY